MQTNLIKLFDVLREKEHNYCLHIWNTIEDERNSRVELQRLSSSISSLKEKVKELRSRKMWTGSMLLRCINTFLFVSWRPVSIEFGVEYFIISNADGSESLARIPSESLQWIRLETSSDVRKDKELILSFKNSYTPSTYISKSVYIKQDHATDSHATLSVVFSAEDDDKGDDPLSEAWIMKFVPFLNSVRQFSEDIAIKIVRDGNVSPFRTSMSDDLCMTSVESLTLSSRGTAGSNLLSDKTMNKHDVECHDFTSSSISGMGTYDEERKSLVGARVSTRGGEARSLEYENMMDRSKGFIAGERAGSDKVGSMVGHDEFDYTLSKYSSRGSESLSNKSDEHLSDIMATEPAQENVDVLKSHYRSVNSRGSMSEIKPKTSRNRRSISVFAPTSSPSSSSSTAAVTVLHQENLDLAGRMFSSTEEGALECMADYSTRINSLRNKRSAVESSLVAAISRREKLLEVVHYLQSLKSLVLNPPDAPSKGIGLVSLPSIDKAIAAYSKWRDRVDKAIDSDSTIDLDDSQVFIASMLEQTTQTSSNNVDGANYIEDSTNIQENIYNITVTPRTGKKRPLGPPPEEIYNEFEEVICCLEELWAADLGTFETVEKLTQLLLLREHTWNRLCELHPADVTNGDVDCTGLFDIVI